MAVVEAQDKDETDLDRNYETLDSPDILALKALGNLKRFDAASQLRELIEGWSVSDFHIEKARPEPDAAPAEHLNEDGSNLALYAQFLADEHPEIFSSLLEKMQERIPGISEVTPEDTGDGRIALRFRDAAFDKGFLARYVSDGTIIRCFASKNRKTSFTQISFRFSRKNSRLTRRRVEPRPKSLSPRILPTSCRMFRSSPSIGLKNLVASQRSVRRQTTKLWSIW
jgi:hypothetical protein